MINRLRDEDGTVYHAENEYDSCDEEQPQPKRQLRGVDDPEDDENDEDPNAGLIEWLKDISLEDLALLEIPPIIPGLNDIMTDDVPDDAFVADIGDEVGAKRRKMRKVKISRGKRGAAEIASACNGALSNPAMRVKEGLECDKYTKECFKNPILLAADKEYYRSRQTVALVLELAQNEARDASNLTWTPLIPVPGVDPDIELVRIEVIASMVEQASRLAKALLQRRGHNMDGQVVCHENFKIKLDAYKRKPAPAAKALPQGGMTISAAPAPPLPSKRKAKVELPSTTMLPKQSQFGKIHPVRKALASTVIDTILMDTKKEPNLGLDLTVDGTMVISQIQSFNYCFYRRRRWLSFSSTNEVGSVRNPLIQFIIKLLQLIIKLLQLIIKLLQLIIKLLSDNYWYCSSTIESNSRGCTFKFRQCCVVLL